MCTCTLPPSQGMDAPANDWLRQTASPKAPRTSSSTRLHPTTPSSASLRPASISTVLPLPDPASASGTSRSPAAMAESDAAMPQLSITAATAAGDRGTRKASTAEE